MTATVVGLCCIGTSHRFYDCTQHQGHTSYADAALPAVYGHTVDKIHTLSKRPPFGILLYGFGVLGSTGSTMFTWGMSPANVLLSGVAGIWIDDKAGVVTFGTAGVVTFGTAGGTDVLLCEL